MGYRGASVVLACACCGMLTFSSPSGAQERPVRVGLSCRVAPDPVFSTGSLLVEIRSPKGAVVRSTFARAGAVVRFKELRPGIYQACISDKSGRRHCQSVDLFPPPEARTAGFSIELKPRASAPQVEGFFQVGKSALSVPEPARRELDGFFKCRQRGEAAAAIRHLRRALAIAPEYPEALIALGWACHAAGDYVRALEIFERVTQIAPEMYAGWLNLGVTLLVSGDPRRALQAEMRALSLRPDDPFVIYQVGLCHYRLGEPEAAKKHLRRVIELDPYTATYPHLLLARIALAQGQKEEAARLVREFSALHPHAPHSGGQSPVSPQDLQAAGSHGQSGSGAKP